MLIVARSSLLPYTVPTSFLISNSISLESANGHNPSTQEVYKRDPLLGRKRRKTFIYSGVKVAC